MMRNDINIAIVTMVKVNATGLNATNTTNVTTVASEVGEFEWSSVVQSFILGSFYCCYVLSQVRSISRQ